MIPATLFLSLIKYGELLLGGDIQRPVTVDAALASWWGFGGVRDRLLFLSGI